MRLKEKIFVGFLRKCFKSVSGHGVGSWRENQGGRLKVLGKVKPTKSSAEQKKHMNLFVSTKEIRS